MYGCGCHGLNNHGADLGKCGGVPKILEAAMRVMKFFRNTPLAKALLKLIHQLFDEYGYSLQPAADTRWNYILRMIQSILRSMEALRRVAVEVSLYLHHASIYYISIHIYAHIHTHTHTHQYIYTIQDTIKLKEDPTRLPAAFTEDPLKSKRKQTTARSNRYANSLTCMRGCYLLATYWLLTYLLTHSLTHSHVFIHT